MASPKRVACFYRVSTKGQMDGEDIPMQRNACRKFAQQKGWGIVKEYVEKGISGYHVSANDRDEIQKAKQDAENGLFDVLLCFMFDRLGRKDDETPFVLKWFSTKNVELWSVKEGEQRFKDHSDDLINYIRFWQSSGESKKTSMRVTESHEQMALEGLYRGGTPAFGYKTVPSGVTNKKGKELLKLAINEYEAIVVRFMYNLVYEKGYGGWRIAKILNEKGKENAQYLTRSGGKWNSGVVNFTLRNPIYKGFPGFGKNRFKGDKHSRQDIKDWILPENQIMELVIVKTHVWDRVQEIRSSRTPDKVKREDTKSIQISKSPLLLVGRIKCGHCGSPLTTTYNTKTNVLKDGTIKKKRYPKYRCSGKALGKTNCDGQTIYSHNKVEGVVLEEVNKYLKTLEKVDFQKEIEKYKTKNMSHNQLKLKQLQKKLEESYQELSTLKTEVSKSIVGKSSFKPELLSSLIDEKEAEIDKTNEEIQEIERQMKAKNADLNQLKTLQEYIPKWHKVFHEADPEKKKMLLSCLIDNVIVRKDSVDIDIKMNVKEFCSSVDIGGAGKLVGCASDVSGRANDPITLPLEIDGKHIEILLAS